MAVLLQKMPNCLTDSLLLKASLTVSCWHSLPKGMGTFHAAVMGVTSLSVHREAVLPLPPKLRICANHH